MGQQNSIHRRGLPSELLNELFVSMPLGNALGLLAKMPNGLLARNVQKMINGTKMEQKGNKWNVKDCSPNLNISRDGISVRYFGPTEWNSVRAVLPIPTLFKSTINDRFSILSVIQYFLTNLPRNYAIPTMYFYFEAQIMNNFGICGIRIGYCDQKFPLKNERLGLKNNSIGIWNKFGIWTDGIWTKFENAEGWFDEGDFVGIGIIQQTNAKMECFATYNGNLLGKAKLPSKFAKVQFFPAISLLFDDTSIRLNFGRDKWLFNDFNRLLN